MKNLVFIFIFSFLAMPGVYLKGAFLFITSFDIVNEHSRWICSFNSRCLSKNAWDEIYAKYAVYDVEDSLLHEKLYKMKNQLDYNNDLIVLHFEDEPEELVAVNYWGAKYVYNSKICDKVLNGLNYELTYSERLRIATRVQNLLMEYQCDEGKRESLKYLETGLSIKP